jgi:plasmid stabilization system protein ParE
VAYKILFTEDALRELEEILDYIRTDNEDAANAFGAALLDHVQLLSDSPLMGTPVRKRAGIRKSYIRPSGFITGVMNPKASSRFCISGMRREMIRSPKLCRPSILF